MIKKILLIAFFIVVSVCIISTLKSKKQKDEQVVEKSQVSIEKELDDVYNPQLKEKIQKKLETRNYKLEHKVKDDLYSELLLKIGVGEEKIKANLNKYENDEMHKEWLDYVDENVGLTYDEYIWVKDNHLKLLCISDINKRKYLFDKYSFDLYKKNLKAILIWHYESIKKGIGEEDTEIIFNMQEESVEIIVDNMLNNISEIYNIVTNPNSNFSEIQQKIDKKKIDKLIRIYKDNLYEKYEIERMLKNNEISSEEARGLIIERYSQFYAEAKILLNDEEYKMMFGSNE